MREATARGPSIDISEFERRLRGGEQQAEKPGKAEAKSDPLAELARLLHGDEAAAAADPYGKVFAEPQRREPSVGNRDVFETTELRGALPPMSPAAQQQSQSDDYYAVRAPAETQWPHQEQQDYLDYGVEVDEPYDEPPERKGFFGALRDRLRPWHAVVALAGVGAVSVGLALGHRGGVVAPQELATIKAPEGPAKVQPSTVAEAAAPQRGAAVLDRNQNAPVKKVVSKQEQPVDPAAAIRVVKLGDTPVDAPHEPAPAGGANNPYGAEPRRVKTVSVRPDGTVIDNDAPTPAIARPAPANVAPPARPPSLAARPSAVEPAAEPPTATPKSPAKPATTPRVAQPPRPKPAPAAAPEQTAAIEPAAPEAAPAGNGGFAVQFGAAGSEDEARRLMQTVNSKYSAQLGGKRLGFRLAKVGEKSVYRVRAAGMSREAAVGVCEKVKASGGSCFVAAN
ncbi:SPOR domain-containing protein [Methylosinus sp. H3A]|uniref:SPOR domain-containing protein n=1 Tax=Methylosinus sp. H3A TaxID=2785786 RepID=UPI0018C301CC|nr:SPOR domain-containing protein [Methylosinus sp. H3A]MBG0811515.1 SPOR domain-containing protein [Methylosinus sp. H3A]